MRVGVIGYGSIGQRHVQNLLELGINDIKLLRLKGNGNNHGLYESYSVDDFFSLGYDFIIISAPTSEHIRFMRDAINNGLNFLCEKPLVSSTTELIELEHLLLGYSGYGAVAMNMRYHPCVIAVKDLIQEQSIGKVLSARFFVGQYLPDWRKNQDYTHSYSAKRNMGGGVVLDLIHEIDLAVNLFGTPKSEVVSVAGKFSNLEIETEDIAEIIYVAEGDLVVSLHLDYVYRGYKREILLIGEKGNILVDLHKNKIKIYGEDNQMTRCLEFPDFVKNDMYIDLLEAFLFDIKVRTSDPASIIDGILVNKIALNILVKNDLT